MSLLKREVNELLLEIRHGDKKAFDKLYDVTAQHLMIIAKNNLNNKNLMEEVIDDVFMKVLKYIKNFDNEKDGYNWLCKITENIARNYNNKCARKTVDLDCVNLPAKDELETVEFSSDIEKAIQILDDRSRKILYYYYYRGLTYAEIARIFKCHRSNVSYHIKQIKKALKNYFFN